MVIAQEFLQTGKLGIGHCNTVSREHQGTGTEHFHAPIHVLDAPKIDENEDNAVTDFIDKYVTCSLPDADQRPVLHALVKKVQTHHHTTTCRKKKGVR